MRTLKSDCLFFVSKDYILNFLTETCEWFEMGETFEKFQKDDGNNSIATKCMRC